MCDVNVGDEGFYVFVGPFVCKFAYFYILYDSGVCSNISYHHFLLSLVNLVIYGSYKYMSR